jgi:hypothetical protein
MLVGRGLAALNQNGFDLSRTWPNSELADFLFSVLPNVFGHFRDLEAANPGQPQWLLGISARSNLKVVPNPYPTGFDVEYNAVQSRTSFRNVQIIICEHQSPSAFVSYSHTVARHPISVETSSAWMDEAFLSFTGIDQDVVDGALFCSSCSQFVYSVCRAVAIP